MEYSGSFDVVPSSENPPDDVPDQCALCAEGHPAWWYVVGSTSDSAGRLVGATALARWWALCTECDRLTALGAVDMLRDRAAAPDVVAALLRWGVRSGHPVT